MIFGIFCQIGRFKLLLDQFWNIFAIYVETLMIILRFLVDFS